MSSPETVRSTASHALYRSGHRYSIRSTATSEVAAVSAYDAGWLERVADAVFDLACTTEFSPRERKEKESPGVR